ncbi:hypothetical protein RCL_jg638.t1 [Rhizophagus clarus]|uniref:Uncharacterized protein n=1 Tax=Rhizophagus clarus TaxID=94130 RepID=A0A8H3LQE5_9GLOM|nr:hypothetical protein RCL_jg638.t1 [Rhizophagus clarus]
MKPVRNKLFSPKIVKIIQERIQVALVELFKDIIIQPTTNNNTSYLRFRNFQYNRNILLLYYIDNQNIS